MATVFPATIDTFTNPVGQDELGNLISALRHSNQHSNHNDSIFALETKVGVDGSAVVTSIDYLLKNAASVDPGHKHSISAISNILITSPANGDVLTYNTGSSKWVNAPPATNGTVTSVSLSAPSQFVQTGSPITTSGTLTFSWNAQTANYGLFGPTSGGSGAPTFRAMVTADIPNGIVTNAKLSATGSADATTYLRGDGTWTVPPDAKMALLIAEAGLTPIVGTVYRATRLPYAKDGTTSITWNFKRAEFHCETTPSGSAAQLDIFKNGVTILSATMSISAGGTGATAVTAFSVGSGVSGDIIAWKATAVNSSDLWEMELQLKEN